MLTFSQQADQTYGKEFLGGEGEGKDGMTPQQVRRGDGEGPSQLKRPSLETVQRLIDWFSKDIRNEGDFIAEKD